MLLAAFFVWVCAMTGVSCESTPNAAIIQTAYEQQAPSSGARHDKGLRIVDASCNHGDENGRWWLNPPRRLWLLERRHRPWRPRIDSMREP